MGDFVYELRCIEFSKTHFSYHHGLPDEAGGIDLRFKGETARVRLLRLDFLQISLPLETGLRTPHQNL